MCWGIVEKHVDQGVPDTVTTLPWGVQDCPAVHDTGKLYCDFFYWFIKLICVSQPQSCKGYQIHR